MERPPDGYGRLLELNLLDSTVVSQRYVEFRGEGNYRGKDVPAVQF
jgi:hypothetical protein